jgi:hypothetical protein
MQCLKNNLCRVMHDRFFIYLFPDFILNDVPQNLFLHQNLWWQTNFISHAVHIWYVTFVTSLPHVVWRDVFRDDESVAYVAPANSTRINRYLLWLTRRTIMCDVQNLFSSRTPRNIQQQQKLILFTFYVIINYIYIINI